MKHRRPTILTYISNHMVRYSTRTGLRICASYDFVQIKQLQHSSRIFHQKSSSQTLSPKTRTVKIQVWCWDPLAKGTDKKIFPQIFQMINESLVLIFSTTFLNYFNLQVIVVQLSCLTMLYQAHSTISLRADLSLVTITGKFLSQKSVKVCLFANQYVF